MFRGILALFKSGLIINPMVFGGILLGFFAVFNLSIDDIYKLFRDWHFYLLIFFAALLYNVIFRKRYKEGGFSLDFVAMFQNSLGGAAMFFIAFFCAISFVVMFLI